MVADDPGPVIDEIDVGLGSYPRHRCGVADQRIILTTLAEESIPDENGGLSTGKRLPVNVDSGDAELCCVIRAVVARLRRIMQMGDTKSDLGKQIRRKDVIVVHAYAIGLLIAGSFKAPACRTAQKWPKGRRLEGDDALKAVSPAHMISFIQRVVEFGVEAVCRLGKGKINSKVIGWRCEISLILVRLRYLPQLIQDIERDRINLADGNLIVGKLRAGTSSAAVASCGIINLPCARGGN